MKSQENTVIFDGICRMDEKRYLTEGRVPLTDGFVRQVRYAVARIGGTRRNRRPERGVVGDPEIKLRRDHGTEAGRKPDAFNSCL